MLQELLDAAKWFGAFMAIFLLFALVYNLPFRK